MTDDEVAKLNYCSEKLGLTKTAVINLGIDKVYAELKGKNCGQNWRRMGLKGTVYGYLYLTTINIVAV